MSKSNIKWKVASEPTGMYRSFNRRRWPSAEYADGRPAASILCEDDYVPCDVKVGNHRSLTVSVCDYSTRDGNCPWTRRNMVRTFATLKEAKDAFSALVESKPEIGGTK